MASGILEERGNLCDSEEGLKIDHVHHEKPAEDISQELPGERIEETESDRCVVDIGYKTTQKKGAPFARN